MELGQREKQLFDFLGSLIGDLESEDLPLVEKWDVPSLTTGEVFLPTVFGEFLKLCRKLRDEDLCSVLYMARILTFEDLEREEGARNHAELTKEAAQKYAELKNKIKRAFGDLSDANVENLESGFYELAATDLEKGNTFADCVAELEYFLEKHQDFLPPHLTFWKPRVFRIREMLEMSSSSSYISERIDEVKRSKSKR